MTACALAPFPEFTWEGAIRSHYLLEGPHVSR
jgi:hypothetical protein